MRNVFVAIVFACIRLSYEFIVPVEILEVVDGTHSIFKNNKKHSNATTNSQEVELIVMPSKSNINKPIDLESNQNRMDDHELFDQNNGKESNINERSFIFINQKFRTPQFGPLFGPLYSPSKLIADTTSVMGHDKDLKHYLEGNPLLFINSRNNPFPSNMQVKETTKQSLYIPIKKPEISHKTYITYGISHTTAKKMDSNTANYVELLKPAILRSRNQATPNQIVEPIWPSFDKSSYSRYQSKKTPKSYIPFESRQLSPINPVIYEPDNDGYPSPFGQRSNKPEEIETVSNFNNQEKYNHKDVIEPRVTNLNNMLIKKILKDNEEVNNILDRYIADPINGSGSNERLDTKIECEQNDCNSELEANIENNHGVKKICKCPSHHWNASSLVNPVRFEINNTIRTHVTTTETNSIELNDYGNLISDETNIDKYVYLP